VSIKAKEKRINMYMKNEPQTPSPTGHYLKRGGY